MADSAVAAAEVQPGSGAIIKYGIAGAAITPGQSVYLSGGRVYLADADAGVSATSYGVSVNGASAAGQPVAYQDDSTITLGATASLTVGTTYVVSATPGGIAPQSDLTVGDDVIILGTADTTSTLKLAINVTGATL